MESDMVLEQLEEIVAWDRVELSPCLPRIAVGRPAMPSSCGFPVTSRPRPPTWRAAFNFTRAIDAATSPWYPEALDLGYTWCQGELHVVSCMHQ